MNGHILAFTGEEELPLAVADVVPAVIADVSRVAAAFKHLRTLSMPEWFTRFANFCAWLIYI